MMDKVHEIFYRLHRNEVGGDGEPLFPGVAELLEEIDFIRRERNEALAELWKIKARPEFGLRNAMEAEHWEPDDYGHEDEEAG